MTPTIPLAKHKFSHSYKVARCEIPFLQANLLAGNANLCSSSAFQNERQESKPLGTQPSFRSEVRSPKKISKFKARIKEAVIQYKFNVCVVM